MNKWSRINFQPCLPLGEDGRRVTASRAHIEISKNAAKEGMVLIKNENGLLPLKMGSRVALFGKASFDYVKGGGGCGDVTVAYVVNLFEGLQAQNDHVQIEKETAEFYRSYVQAQYDRGVLPGMLPEPELPEQLVEKASEFAETAIISVCRYSEENLDRSISGDAIFEDGDFYLSHAERSMVEQVMRQFSKVIVVLNVGGMIDTTWFAETERIQSVLLAWQGGMEGGMAAAELLCGNGTPSGKLPDTFAKRLEDYPSTEGFFESDDYVDYTEDIYVGYRYFETIPGARDKVVYPFGFGLSYTTFALNTASVSAREVDREVCVKVEVTNTGAKEGKEVVQIYGSAPQGLLGKPHKCLLAFQKTKLLQPGESQLLTLKFMLSSIASYDDLGKVKKSAWVLEKGAYFFYVGTSVRDAQKLDFAYELQDDVVVEQLSPKLVPASLKKRMLADGSYEELPLGISNDPDYTELKLMQDIEKYGELQPMGRSLRKLPAAKRYYWSRSIFPEVADGKLSLDAFISKLSNSELAGLLEGQQNTGVANTFGIGNMKEYYIPNAMTADGPAGLRIKKECGVCTTAFPCATLLASTWDPEILYQVGEAGAKEVKENNIAIWLTPGVNIHRNPLCGRNFEYYSEDPLLAGMMGAAMVSGIQSQNISCSVKHFALNNKETNRKNSDSRVSERAAREIYLKVFEIIVKTAKPWYIMSAYNIINGHRASENKELLEDILRDEWEFDGMVSTDWFTYGEHYKEVQAGCDLKMASGSPDRLLAALEKGVLTRAEMERSVKRVLGLLLKFD